MDDQLVEQVRAALHAATEGVRVSSALDERVHAILNDRPSPRRLWVLPSLAAVVVLVLAAVAVAVLRNDGDERRVAAGPDASATWNALATSPLGARVSATMVWTGKELIVWGGLPDPAIAGDTGDGAAADGAALDPATNTWRRLAPSPLAARYGHVAVWTGTEMIVWGGIVDPRGSEPDGAAYDPSTNRWRTISASSLGPPSAASLGSGQLAVWSGTEMLVWKVSGDSPNDGAAYDPSTDRWRALARMPGAPPVELLAWTGRTVIAFPKRTGPLAPAPGQPGSRGYLEASEFDPSENKWTALPSSQLFNGPALPIAQWTGEELLAASPPAAGFQLPPGARWSARYRPGTGAWRSMTDPPFSGPFSATAQAWTGSELLVIGLEASGGLTAGVYSGAAYDPASDEWRRIFLPDGIEGEVTAVTTDDGVLVYSGGMVFRFG